MYEYFIHQRLAEFKLYNIVCVYRETTRNNTPLEIVGTDGGEPGGQQNPGRLYYETEIITIIKLHRERIRSVLSLCYYLNKIIMYRIEQYRDMYNEAARVCTK